MAHIVSAYNQYYMKTIKKGKDAGRKLSEFAFIQAKTAMIETGPSCLRKFCPKCQRICRYLL